LLDPENSTFQMNELALFAGAGGGILGAKLLGWRTVCAVEIDTWNKDVLLARQRDGVLPHFPIWDDVTTFDGTRWRGFVDILTGGFPCQDISSAGSGDGLEGERSGLWKHMARIVGEVSPQYVLVENSPNLTGRGLGVVLGDLAALGYDARWGVLGARHAGAIHKRDRIWILADATGERTNPRENVRTCNQEMLSGKWWANTPDGAFAADGRLAGKIPLHLGMDDGMAGWMERLKATGNGQVPAVVRIAWNTLRRGRGV
jgi:DNA (cytosine-5)-methyltransferase 1